MDGTSDSRRAGKRADHYPFGPFVEAHFARRARNFLHSSKTQNAASGFIKNLKRINQSTGYGRKEPVRMKLFGMTPLATYRPSDHSQRRKPEKQSRNGNHSLDKSLWCLTLLVMLISRLMGRPILVKTPKSCWSSFNSRENADESK